MVSIVSQFTHSPLKRHMKVVLRILKYLKATQGKGLIFKKNGELHVEENTNADWLGQSRIEDQPQGTTRLLGAIRSLGEAKSKMLCLDEV